VSQNPANIPTHHGHNQHHTQHIMPGSNSLAGAGQNSVSSSTSTVNNSSGGSMSSYLGTFPAAAAASFFYSQLYLNDFDPLAGQGQGHNNPRSNGSLQGNHGQQQIQGQQHSHPHAHSQQHQQQQIQHHQQQMMGAGSANPVGGSDHVGHSHRSGRANPIGAANAGDSLSVWRPYWNLSVEQSSKLYDFFCFHLWNIILLIVCNLSVLISHFLNQILEINATVFLQNIILLLSIRISRFFGVISPTREKRGFLVLSPAFSALRESLV